MSKHVISDVDGVLLLWNSAFEDFMLQKGFPRVNGTDQHYGITQRFGISVQQQDDYISEFNHSDSIKNLEPFADSLEYIPKIVNLGYRFIVVTSLGGDDNSRKNRRINLETHFGDIFDEVHCLGIGQNKYDVLCRWEDSKRFWIEDSPIQAEAGYAAGLRSILISHPYNELHDVGDRYPIVSNHKPWEEIYHMILMDS